MNRRIRGPCLELVVEAGKLDAFCRLRVATP